MFHRRSNTDVQVQHDPIFLSLRSFRVQRVYYISMRSFVEIIACTIHMLRLSRYFILIKLFCIDRDDISNPYSIVIAVTVTIQA
jgi:hypothetical protein